MRDVRRPSLVAALSVAAVMAAAGCGDDEEAGETRAAKPVAGEFVGSVDSPGRRESVAVVAGSSKDASGSRKVRVYVCDSAKQAAWFTGSVKGNKIDLTSKDGKARVRLSLSKDAARGQAEMPNGRTVAFNAPRATGAAGLFTTRHTRTGTTG